MNQSVVAVFENREQAEQARQQLIATGFPSERVSLQPGAGADSATQATESSARADDGESGIGHFFRSLFGMEDDRPDYYEEAARRGHATLIVHADGEDEVDQIRALLERCDVVDIEERAMQWRSEAPGGSGQTAGRGMASRRGETAADTTAAIPVIEEEIQVGKREVERGRVRVYSRVMERPVEESVQLREERARVTRQPVDRPATEEDFAAFKEGSMEIRETAEIPVVQKQARVVEEVQVGKQVEQRAETVRDKVRKTEVRVDEEAPAASRNESVRGREKGKPR